MHRSRALPFLLLVIGLAAPACKGLKTGAKEEFAKKYSCPDDRVKVVERKDLQAYEVIFGKTEEKEPPDEVKDDPERLAKWKADHAESDSKGRSYFNSSYDVFQVSGCDHDVVMACHHPTGSKGGQRMDQVSCSEQKEDRFEKKLKKKQKKSKDKDD